MNSEFPETTPDRSSDGRRFAESYREDITDRDPDEVSHSLFTGSTILDLTYLTRANNERTLRVMTAMSPGKYDDYPEGFLAFHHGNTRYAYNPEQRVLMTANRDAENRVVAKGDQIRTISEVRFPTAAVVVGKPQKDVEAKVFYRSNRSGRIKTMQVEVDFMEGRHSPGSFAGHSIGLDTRVDLLTRWERTIETTGKRGRTLGRVVRVEFPRGHRFVVDVHGIENDAAERVRSQIRHKIDGLYRDSTIKARVEHEGPIPNDAEPPSSDR